MVKSENNNDKNPQNKVIKGYGVVSAQKLPRLTEDMIETPTISNYKSNFEPSFESTGRQRVNTWTKDKFDIPNKRHFKAKSIKLQRQSTNPESEKSIQKLTVETNFNQFEEKNILDQNYSIKTTGKFGLGIDKKEDLKFINMKKLFSLCEVYNELEKLQNSRPNLKFLSNRKYLENTPLYKLLLYDYLKIIMHYQETENPFDVSDYSIMKIIRKKKLIHKFKKIIEKVILQKLRDSWAFLRE